MSKPHDIALRLYLSCGLSRRDFRRDLHIHARKHYCFSTPEYLILARDWPKLDCWHVHLAIGRGALSKFFSLSPHSRRWVAFARPENGRWNNSHYDYERMKKLCIRHDIYLNRH